MTTLRLAVVMAAAVAQAEALSPVALGFDYGTSGARVCAIDLTTKEVVDSASFRWEADSDARSPDAWVQGLDELLAGLSPDVRQRATRMCVGGTSSSVLMVSAATGEVTRGVRMYDCNLEVEVGTSLAESVAEHIDAVAPPSHTVRASSSTLSKVLAWALETPFLPDELVAHQADYVTAHLLAGNDGRAATTVASVDGRPGFVSDWHNALKLGFDLDELAYPGWLVEDESVLVKTLAANAKTANDGRRGSGLSGSVQGRFPRVVEPGSVIGRVSAKAAARWGLQTSCEVCAGTTDSIAAFLASGASTRGTAVTSLGSTTVIKMLSDKRVDDAARGIYSHRLGDLWLVGGASNVGCAVLRSEGFSNDELAVLSDKIDPLCDTGLDYYPLVRPGERFPENDPAKPPKLDPKPSHRAEYLQGIFEGIARVEAQGYSALAELGASELTAVFTAGGGSVNAQWTAMRERMLGVPTSAAPNTDASFGLALLAVRKL